MLLPSRPRVGPWRGERLLALGGRGAVWIARGPGGPVALKVARGADEADAARAFAEEAAALRTAAHPHLVRLVQSGPGWLATELVEGETLDRWARGRPAGAVIDRALELLGALRHLHARGLCHGDVAPANVLVDAHGHVKLVDVGGRESATGTPGFTAPERLRGGPPTEASDLYGFAATIYAALAGRPPFASADPAALLHLPVTTSPLPVGAWRVDVPDAVERLLASLLLRNPARRPPAEEVERVLVRAWKVPPRRPVLGMVRARAKLHEAVARAADGRATVVLLHGPTGSGRRTLLGEAMRQARLEGLEVHRRYDPNALFEAARAGRRPVAATRLASAQAVEEARALLQLGAPALLVLFGPAPSQPLAAAGAVHITPDALSTDDARHLGTWLGVEREEDVMRAWRRSQGHPRALWIALEPYATRHTEDRTPFSLPSTAAAVVAALRDTSGMLPLDRLASRTRLPLPVVVDQLAVLEATGRIRTEGDGWLVQWIGPDEEET